MTAAVAVPERSPIQADRFISGDALRGLAALTVLGSHTASGVVLLGERPEPIEQVFGDRGGPLLIGIGVGLYLFFPLSGYVLSRPFLRAGRKVSLRRYFKNRALRIIPALWFLVAFMLIRHGPVGSSFGEVISVPLFLQNFNWSPFADLNFHVWTLGVETIFYVLVPLAMFVRRLRLPVFLGLMAVVWVIGIKYQSAGAETELTRRALGVLIYAMLPGIAFAALEPVVRPRVTGNRRIGTIVCSLAFTYALVAFYVLLYNDPTAGNELGLRSTLASAIVGAAILHEWTHGRPYRLLSIRPVQWLGERSYGFYLWHIAVAIEVRRLFGTVEPGWDMFFLLAFLIGVGSCVMAWISFRFVEQPFLRRRGGWAQDGAPAGRGAGVKAEPQLAAAP